MKKATIIAATVASVLWGTSVLADTDCEMFHDGNTWNLICAAGDGNSSDADYDCSFQVNVTNKDGESGEMNASGSVEKGQNNAIIWSNIQYDGSDIVSASIGSGSCTPR